jgi:tetratricopeptide (TPR) repeat protein
MALPPTRATLALALALAALAANAQAPVPVPPIPPGPVGPGGMNTVPLPQQPRTPFQDAVRLQRRGELDPALDAVQKHLATNPQDVQGRFLRGVILAEQKRPKEATEAFLELTREHPELPEPFNNLAVIYAADGRYEDAREALEQSLLANPTNTVAQENLGDVYAQLARKHYERALEGEPRSRSLRMKLAAIAELGKIRIGDTASEPNLGDKK